MTGYRHRVFVFLCVFLAIIGVSLRPAGAFTDLTALPKLTYDKKNPDEALKKHFEIHDEKPFNDPRLEMRIALPIGWVRYETESVPGKKDPASADSPSKIPAYGSAPEAVGTTTGTSSSDPALSGMNGGDMFRLLARYSTPPRVERRSEFRVRSIEIKKLISLQDWFIEFMMQMGFSPEGVNIKSPNRLEAQYTLFEHGEPMTTRAVIERSGSKIILAEYLVHQENYEAESDEQIKAMEDFALLNPDMGQPLPLNTYTFIDIAKFDYPKSWILYSPGITTIDRMEASVINIKGDINDIEKNQMRFQQLDGRVDVTVVSKYTHTTAAAEVALIGKSLTARSLVLGDKMGTVPVPTVHNKIISSTVTVYHISPIQAEYSNENTFSAIGAKTSRLADYEYWLAVLETKGRYYFVRLLTIGRDEDFDSWAENTEVFRTLLSSIAPVNDQVH